LRNEEERNTVIVPLFSRDFVLRRAFLVFFVLAGTSGAVAIFAGLFCGCLSHSILSEALFIDALLWFPGVLFLDSPLRWAYLLIPVALPLAGPILSVLGVTAYLLARRKNPRGRDPVFRMLFHPVDRAKRVTSFTLEEILAQDRKIVPAGDILRWGDVSLKQAVIDRLSSEGASPRAIRVLKGARNDPDEEVRLFATTILTRLEKIFQEKIKLLLSTPDPLRPWAELGKVHFEYAASGLVGQTLARVHVAEGLRAYRKALQAEESLTDDEFLSVGTHAISQGSADIEQEILGSVERMGKERERKHLEWMKLYENGDFAELQKDMRMNRGLFGHDTLAENMKIWISENHGAEG
jgi:hypothetical protein